jgi:phosphate:Na+ symporter
LSAGVLFKLLAGNRRWQGLGVALAGFGLFFLGLGLLKEAFEGAAQSFGARVVGGEFRLGVLGGLGIGLVATVLTQSSSAAIALFLSAAASGVLGFDAAAAAVIGANIGTTSTAALAVLKATPAARRLALGHIVFNLLAGVVALLLLGPLLWLVQWLAAHVDLGQGVAGVLALFHTVFNVLGVLLMLPLTELFARRLERWFAVQAEEAGRPQYLDHTLRQTPALALAAVLRELARMQDQVREALRLAAVSTDPEAIRPLQESVRALGEAITQYVADLRGGVLEASTAQGVTRALAVVRNLREAVRLAPELCALRRELAHQPAAAVAIGLRQWLDGIATTVAGADPKAESAHLAEILERAHLLRLEVLEALVGGQLRPADVDRLLDALAAVRRALTQWLEGLAVAAQLRQAANDERPK